MGAPGSGRGRRSPATTTCASGCRSVSSTAARPKKNERIGYCRARVEHVFGRSVLGRFPRFGHWTFADVHLLRASARLAACFVNLEALLFSGAEGIKQKPLQSSGCPHLKSANLQFLIHTPLEDGGCGLLPYSDIHRKLHDMTLTNALDFLKRVHVKHEIPKGTLAAMLASRQSITLHDDISKYETFIRSFFAEPSDLRDSVLGRFITENEQARSFFLSSQRRTACRRKVPTPLPVSAPFHALVSRFECIPRTSPKGRHQHFDEAVQKSLARCLDPDRPEDIFARIAASPVNERAS